MEQVAISFQSSTCPDDDGSSMGNAFWNGQAMFYGNGDANLLSLARALDDGRT